MGNERLVMIAAGGIAMMWFTARLRGGNWVWEIWKTESLGFGVVVIGAVGSAAARC
jgi:hypothetical protein